MREQDARGREVEYRDRRAHDGDVASSNLASAVRLPADEEGEKRTEERREQGEKQ